MMGKKRVRNFLADVVFIGPVLLAFTMIVLVPLMKGIFLSFTDWNGMTYQSFVGFKNFKNALTDQSFGRAFLFTFKFAAMAVILINVTGFSLALLVTRNIRCSTFMRAVFYMPNLIGGLTLGFVWNFIFVEIFPAVGEKLGISFLNGWLADAKTGLWGLVILTTWQMSGYMMIIYIAALQNISADIIESARIDGAGFGMLLRKIMIPMVMPSFTVSIFLTLSNTFKLYDQNLALTGGGPGDSTTMISMNIYNTAYRYNQNALGQAKAIIFLLVVLTITLTQVYFSKKKEEQLR